MIYPKRKVIPARELFALPRPKRLQRMDRNHKRDAIILSCQNPAKMSVPRVTMHEVGIDVGGIEIDASPDCPESGSRWFRTGEITRVEFETGDLEVALFKILVAKTTHLHRHRLCQFAREITHMHTCTAVDVWRVLVCEEKQLHARFRSL